jgi:hypothetical protein
MPFAKTSAISPIKDAAKAYQLWHKFCKTDMTLMTQRLTLILGALPCCVYDAFFPRCPREMECLLQSFF